MCTVTFVKTLCGALAFACIAAGAACQQRAVPVESNSNATNATTTTNATTNTNTTPGPTPAVSEGTFTGTSLHESDFNKAWAEALANAVAAAKKGLNTLKVEWRQEELSGVHGGYTPQYSVTVKIHARAVYP